MADHQETTARERPAPHQELIAVLGICLAIFILICLAGYSLPPAPGETGQPAWGGRIGWFSASLLMSFLGFSSFWIFLLCFIFSILFFSPKASLARLPQICAGSSGIIIASSSLLAASGVKQLVIGGHIYPAGGYLGDLLYLFMREYFGAAGAVIFFLCLFTLSLMAALEFSPYLMFCTVGDSLARLFNHLADRCRAHWTARREITTDKPENPEPEEPLLTIRPSPTVDETGEEMIISVPKTSETVSLTGDEDDEFHPVLVTTDDYRLPGVNLLDKSPQDQVEIDREHYLRVSKKLGEKLKDFGVNGKVSGISPGPVITSYEFEPAPGVKINKIVNLADDLALGLKAESVRIVGSIPGKSALGIEVPNYKRQIVYIRDILAGEEFQKAGAKLTLGLGMDVVGNPVIANLAKMPHLLIAGATGAGKSVGINTIICSILMKANPEEVRLLMIDPKRIELSCYDDIPHLLHPVVVDPKMASRALQWAVREMERRYQLMEEKKVKSITSYNEVSEDEQLPLIVIIIDELADLMMVSSRDVEDSVARLAQMARAAGMHLILATQRPSVDVLTGLIKANFPTRMSFKVSSKIDSRTILDGSGAEHLLGAGDMLFLPPGTARLQRIHGAYISEKEIERIVSFVKDQRPASYDNSVIKIADQPDEEGDDGESEFDDRYDEAVALVCETAQASISMVQRRLRVGYNRAARMIEMMEKEGIVGPADGAKPREVLVKKNY